ncbi:MAG: UDP-3-O-(3-hydroxymyristoyl)glucosamine N-acyltransferase [Gammaproteobacteria bacterium]|nr:UDP-3-O-(3-hydroxymyristoyl)glucosamine N-acyltransferase [Gammaproteobacteria bacterium]
MKWKASQVFESFQARGIIDEMIGPDTDISRFDPIEDCTSSSLVFVDDAGFVEQAIASTPAAIVTTAKLVEHFSGLSSTAILSSKNVRLAQAFIRQAYADHDHRDSGWPAIHPAAIIHESAVIDDEVILGPGAVVGRNVKIGRGSIVKANTVLEQDVNIGEDCILYPNVVVAQGCVLGNRVILKSGCVIGMEGFGFAQDEKGRSHRIPQTGRVVIEDDVMIGSNCNIDRATYDETRIRAGCKFDALIHIAHNVDIGEDCLVLAHSTVAGSSTIGRGVIMSGQTGVLDHINIADRTILVQRAGVINDIEKPGTYAGLPTQPLADYFKNTAVAHKLVELRKQVRQLEKQVADLTKEK